MIFRTKNDDVTLWHRYDAKRTRYEMSPKNKHRVNYGLTSDHDAPNALTVLHRAPTSHNETNLLSGTH